MDMVAGIDCGKAFLDVALAAMDARVRVPNDARGSGQLREWLDQHGVGRVGIEATGGYERQVCRVLRGAGIAVQVLNPFSVRHYAKASGRRAKSDLIDAKVIAAFTAAFPSAGTVVRGEAEEALADLVRTRLLLVEKRADLINAREMVDGPAYEALVQIIESLNGVIETLEAQIWALIHQHESLALKSEALSLVPGIGPVITSVLLALLPELGSVSNQQIAALAGVAPYDNDSGQHHGYRHIAGGRVEVRHQLYMAAMVAATRAKGSSLGQFYTRLRTAGKPGKVALVACMRKLLVRLNTMLATGQHWQEYPA